MQESKGLTTRDITFAAVGIALLAVSGWVTVTLGPIPFTLQTMAVIFEVLALSPRQSVISVFGFLVLGGLGLPLFGGMSGGVSSLLGPAGGFLFGFGFGVLAALPVRHLMPEGVVRDVVVALVVSVVVYAIGLVWFMFSTGASFVAAFAACVAPFLVTDTIKAACGITLANAVRRAVPALSLR